MACRCVGSPGSRRAWARIADWDTGYSCQRKTWGRRWDPQRCARRCCGHATDAARRSARGTWGRTWSPDRAWLSSLGGQQAFSAGSQQVVSTVPTPPFVLASEDLGFDYTLTDEACSEYVVEHLPGHLREGADTLWLPGGAADDVAAAGYDMDVECSGPCGGTVKVGQVAFMRALSSQCDDLARETHGRGHCGWVKEVSYLTNTVECCWGFGGTCFDRDHREGGACSDCTRFCRLSPFYCLGRGGTRYCICYSAPGCAYCRCAMQCNNGETFCGGCTGD